MGKITNEELEEQYCEWSDKYVPIGEEIYDITDKLYCSLSDIQYESNPQDHADEVADKIRDYDLSIDSLVGSGISILDDPPSFEDQDEYESDVDIDEWKRDVEDLRSFTSGLAKIRNKTADLIACRSTDLADLCDQVESIREDAKEVLA